MKELYYYTVEHHAKNDFIELYTGSYYQLSIRCLQC